MRISNDAMQMSALALVLSSTTFALTGYATLESVKIHLSGRLAWLIDSGSRPRRLGPEYRRPTEPAPKRETAGPASGAGRRFVARSGSSPDQPSVWLKSTTNQSGELPPPTSGAAAFDWSGVSHPQDTFSLCRM